MNLLAFTKSLIGVLIPLLVYVGGVYLKRFISKVNNRKRVLIQRGLVKVKVTTLKKVYVGYICSKDIVDCLKWDHIFLEHVSSKRTVLKCSSIVSLVRLPKRFEIIAS